jgi:hypothetical protein
MSSAKEFREFAQECLRWAEETRDEKERQALLDLAKQLAHAALHTVEDDTPLAPPPGNWVAVLWRRLRRPSQGGTPR